MESGILAYFDNDANNFKDVASQGAFAVSERISNVSLPSGAPAQPRSSYAGASEEDDNAVSAPLAKWVRAHIWPQRSCYITESTGACC